MNTNAIKETMKETSQGMVNETVSTAQINVGKVIYKNAKVLLQAYLPKPKWYEKLFISQEKRELAELIAVYGLLHLIKAKYNHYFLDSLTLYINFELQTRLIGVISVTELDNIFKLPTKVE